VTPPFSFSAFNDRVQALAAQYEGQVKLIRARTRHVAREAFISSSVPTVILRRDGQVLGQAIGDLTTAQLDVVLRAALR
jgi:hypothetical protein